MQTLALIAVILSYGDNTPTTYETWSGCRQIVYVLDAGRPRKLVRFEAPNNARGRLPGTGEWGPWLEDFCEPAGARTWSCRVSEWPRPVNQRDVLRLLGDEMYRRFQADTKARVTSTWNLTPLPFVTIGVPMTPNND